MNEPESPLLGVYRTPEAAFVRGEGTRLVDEDGRVYLDFTAGIGVNALGHGSPLVRHAIEAGLETGLIHVSNLFRTQPAAHLAQRLADHSSLAKVFFCNSGGEAVEGAIKFSRKWARGRGGGQKHRIVALRGSFHGRLYGSLAVTDRPDYQDPFRPMMPGVDFVDPADPRAVREALSAERTAALILEPIQGEVGIRPLSSDFLRSVREWTTERGIALILDEIQCGLGRSGTLFAHEPSGITPDILCLAKALGGGLPMGAVVLSREIAAAMAPGDHGTTFGGGPLVSSVARAVLDTIAAPEFLRAVRVQGDRLKAGLLRAAEANPGRVVEVRGRGLLLGVELSGPAGPVVDEARERGLLTVPAGARVVRLLPPLTVRDSEIDQAVEILAAALAVPASGT